MAIYAKKGKQFDATGKDLIDLGPADWLRYLGVSVSDVQVIDAEVSTVTAAADGGSLLRVDLNNPAGVERVRIRLSRPDLGEDLLDTQPSGDGGWVLNNNEIAQRLVLSPKTVRNLVSNIFSKLQVADRAQAVIRAREAGLGTGSR